MNRDFEMRQLLRAYRSGLMSEAAFEEEMALLEHNGVEPGGSQAPGFQSRGQMYRSERDALIAFLDELHATQMDSAIAFAKWSAVCRTKGLRTGLMMIAERKAAHARMIERRVHELGGVLHATTTEYGNRLAALLGNVEISETQKLNALASLISEPQQAVAPITEFAAALTNDIESRQALRLLAEDELSSAAWLHDIATALDVAEPSAPTLAK